MEDSLLYAKDSNKALKLRLCESVIMLHCTRLAAALSKASTNVTLMEDTAHTASTSDENTYDFAPTFTYPIFGEQEIIYGYRDLVIKLYFASGSLKNYLSIEYSGEPLTGDKVIDIEKTLYEFIPPGRSFVVVPVPNRRSTANDLGSISQITRKTRLHSTRQ